MAPIVVLLIIIITSFLCLSRTVVQTAYVTTTLPETLTVHKVKSIKRSSPKTTSTHKLTSAVNLQKSSKPHKRLLKPQKPSSSPMPPKEPPSSQNPLTPGPYQKTPRPTKQRFTGPCDSKKSSVHPTFVVDMIRPFGTSTIRYVYTELRSPVVTPQPVYTTRPDQAHSVNVLPYSCGNDGAVWDDSRNGRLRRRKRRRRKKIVVTVENFPIDDDRATNTVLPLLSDFPTDDLSSNRVVLKLPADQLDLLYTIRRGTTSRKTSNVKADEHEHSETSSVALDTFVED